MRKTENFFKQNCGKHLKDNEKWRSPEKKKPREARKTSNFPQKTGNGPPITPPL